MSSNGDSSKRIKTSSPTFEQLASSTHPPNNTEYPYDDDDPNDLRTESFPTADQGETPSCGISRGAGAVPAFDCFSCGALDEDTKGKCITVDNSRRDKGKTESLSKVRNVKL